MNGPAAAMSGTSSSTGTSAGPRSVPGVWINVVVAAVLMVGTLPGRTQGLGLITEPLLGDLGIDRLSYATINLWATLLGAAACLPIGRLFDRIGLRTTTFGITILLGAVVWAMSRLTSGPVLLFVLVLATRALGQSALSVASITAVGKSFDRRVGVAMGAYSVLLSLMFAGAFVVVGNAVRIEGWRVAWAQVAYALLLVVGPLVWFLREPQRAVVSPDARTEHDGLPLAAALRTRAFWVFGVATSLFGLVSSGLGLFNQAVLAARGFDQQTYVRFLAATSIMGLVGQFTCGWLTLRWPMPRLLGLAMFVYAAALAAIPLISTHQHLRLCAALIGLSGGMITVIFFAVWGRAFGRAHLGRIQGAAQMLTVLASAIGPLIFAESQATTGSYTPVLWTLAPCVLLLGLVALRTSMPSPDPIS